MWRGGQCLCAATIMALLEIRVNCFCDSSRQMAGGYCLQLYSVSNTARNFVDAEEVCRKSVQQDGDVFQGVGLASITNADIYSAMNSVLAESLKSGDVDDLDDNDQIWLGGREEAGAPVWRWIEDGRRLFHQGCYEYSGRESGRRADNNVSSCLNSCSGDGFAANKPDRCICANSLASFRATGSSNCQGNYDMNIYAINGAAGDWAHNQPDNTHKGDLCASFANEDFYNYKLIDEKCNVEKRKGLCRIPCDEAYDFEVNGSCILVTRSRRTWYVARAECKALSGDLLSIGTEAFRLNVSEALSREGRYWVGAVATAWTWSSGDALVYSYWERELDYGKGDNCLAAKYDRNERSYRMTVRPCNSRYHYLCQYVQVLTTDAPSTVAITTELTTMMTTENITTEGTTAVTMPTTTLLRTTLNGDTSAPAKIGGSGNSEGSIAPSGETGGITPAAARSNSDGSLSTVGIVLIVLAILLFIIILAAILIYCYMKNKDKSNGQVAPAPSGGRGKTDDRVYISPGESSRALNLTFDSEYEWNIPEKNGHRSNYVPPMNKIYIK